MRTMLISIGLMLLTLLSVACGSELETPVSVSVSPGATSTTVILSTPAANSQLSNNSPNAIPSIQPTALASNPTASSITALPTFSSTAAASPTRLNATPTAANIIIAPTPTQENLKKATNATLPKATIAPTPTPTFTPALDPKAALASNEKPDAEEQSFLQQLNQYRQANGRNPLTFDPLLFRSARWLAQDMATRNYVSHTDSQGRAIAERIKAFGYPGGWVGENIAGGLEQAADNLSIWQSDDIHKNNLLGPNYTKAGVGRYYVKSSLNRWYWVLDLG